MMRLLPYPHCRPAILAGAAFLASCASARDEPSKRGDSDSITPSPYLYVWAGDADRAEGDQDFLIVVDVDPSSRTFGDVLATAPVGSTGSGPHHAEPVAPQDGLLFANGFSGDRTFLFDLTSPMQPVVAGELELPPGYNFLHTFLRMQNGHVLTTAQEGGRDHPGTVGGLVEFDAEGEYLQAGSAAAEGYETIRPYAIDLFPHVDRVLSTSFSMKLERSDNVVQLWRLSDLTLLATIPVPPIHPTNDPPCYFDELVAGDECSVDRVPGHDRTFEIRRLTDDLAILNTLTCGFYAVSGVQTDALELEVIMNWPDMAACGVTTIVGHYYIVPVGLSDRVISVDVSDPLQPSPVDTLYVGDGLRPHWTQVDPGTNRFILTGNGPSGPMVRLYHVDPNTGEITPDGAFGSLDLLREVWPHGTTGPAAPHAALFGR